MVKCLKWSGMAVLGLALALGVQADEKKLSNPEAGKCPVAKKDIKAGVTADVGGKTYGFCCNGCVKKFTADPAKYLPKEK